jgi:nucleoside phosphorylase
MPILCRKCKATTAVDLQTKPHAPSTKAVSLLPAADFLIVTWTAEETAAMATVFGAGQYHFTAGSSNNFTPLVLPGLNLPSREKCHAHFFQTSVNGKSVVCLKSEFHPKLETAGTTTFFERIIRSNAGPRFKYAITSGTSGGIWKSLDIGDVVVTNKARYGLTMPQEKQTLVFTGAANLLGRKAPQGSANWFDYVNSKILSSDTCVNTALATSGGRTRRSKPAIYYKASSADHTDVVTNSRISDDEYGRRSFYRTIGATLDENDAYVAEAFKAVQYVNWVSIRNVSDLPSPKNNDAQYDTFQFCSSINGAYAAWAFVMGH